METETRIKALAKYLDCDIEDIEPTKYSEKTLEVGHGQYPDEYLVVTDEEADEEWEERLNSYLEECVLPELDKSLRFYFDDEKWKRDARMDGRGHSISGYDGCENDIEIDGETIYIFRLN